MGLQLTRILTRWKNVSFCAFKIKAEIYTVLSIEIRVSSNVYIAINL